MVRYLRKVQAVRVSGGWETLKIAYENTIARPVSRAAFEASELWVLEHGEGDPFMEYVTADEMVPDFPDQPYGSQPAALADEDLVRQLQARIVDLESQAAAARGNVPAGPAGVRTSRRTISQRTSRCTRFNHHGKAQGASRTFTGQTWSIGNCTALRSSGQSGLCFSKSCQMSHYFFQEWCNHHETTRSIPKKIA